MTMAEVAAMLGRSVDTLRYWRWRGEGIPSYKIGRRVVYDVEAVEAYLAAQRAKGQAGGAA
jgi:excisionase family DNA binding protein